LQWQFQEEKIASGCIVPEPRAVYCFEIGPEWSNYNVNITQELVGAIERHSEDF